MTKAQIASRRVGVLKERGISNRALEQLSHELNLWEQHTGKSLGGKYEGYKMTAPKNTTERERQLLNSILDTFLSDDTSTIAGIKNQFKSLPSSSKKSGKEYSIGEKATALDIAERMRKEQYIKNMVGSDQYHYMWNLYKENYKKDYEYKDFLDAMYQTTIRESSDIEMMVLGEDETFSSWSTESDFEDATIDYLLNVMEKRR